jgi:uncharacterized circularly permuted ATP-grasp superfamily protein/uncharacterized alpha-E superfamily protein
MQESSSSPRWVLPSHVTSDGLNRPLIHARPVADGHFDEMQTDPRGGIGAAHWDTFFAQMTSLGVDGLDRQHRLMQRQVQDNGVTYNVYADRDGPKRPWALDLFPLLLDGQDWAELSAGIAQRARVLEALMRDAYGPQQLLRQALVPGALVLGHPGFVRELHGYPPVGDTHLHVAAFDVSRDAQGRWAVISQRTQAPSGLGYLLENRSIISRQFPQAFAQLQVHALEGTYRRWLQSLRAASPAGDRAHVALLTPGPYNETYFEHAYLARHLGITLVEGHDLTVRGQQLFLRTLRGLEQIHVLIKRLDDGYLDPLELMPDSTLGVPGLLQVVRAGQLVLSNPPGTAWLESPALLGFLPALCERILHETLSLPSLDTWWCGERAAMDAILPRLADTVIKPTYPEAAGLNPITATLGRDLSSAQRDEWRGRIVREPQRYTLQSYQPLSQMPTWRHREIQPRSMVLRLFALRTGRHEWQVLPGGLVRIASMQDEITSMQRGGSSADVWVLRSPQVMLDFDASREESAIVPADTLARTTAAKSRLVTSRSAEDLFWLGRYTERSDNAQRLARLCLHQIHHEDPPLGKTWMWLQMLCERNGLVPAGVPSAGSADVHKMESRRRLFERTLLSGLNDHTQLASVGYNLRAMQRTASGLRERLSPQQWQAITQLVDGFTRWHPLPGQDPDHTRAMALTALDEAADWLAAIIGAQNDRMTRDDGWQLLTIGRLLERMLFLLDVLTLVCELDLLSPEHLPRQLPLLLEVFDCAQSFQAEHADQADLSDVCQLLVWDGEQPRALHWVSRSLRARLSKLGQVDRQSQDPLAQMVPDFSRASEILQPGFRDRLHQARQAIWQVSDAIATRYFSHAGRVGSVGA